MSLPPPAPPSPRARSRSLFVTVLAWLFIVVGGALSVISAISLLMLVAGSHGSASADAAGILSVVVAPPVAAVTGFGLLFRRRWAWVSALVLLAGLAALNVRELLNARPTTTTTTSPSGVKTTVLASGPNYHSVPLIALALAAAAKLLTRGVRSELGAVPSGRPAPRPAEAPPPLPATAQPAATVTDPPDDRGWRVGHQGRDRMYYEESHDGAWRRLELDGEMLTGRAHHVIYFASPARWQGYPEWARHRRDEIIARIKSAFRPPDYEYQESATASVGPAAVPAPMAHGPSRGPTATAKQRATAWFAIVLLFGLAGGLGWLVQRGIDRGTTMLPIHRASFQRPITRAQEPVMFWFSLGLYSVLGLGAGGLAVWLTRETLRLQVVKK